VGKIGDHPNTQKDNQASFLRRAGLYLGIAFELPSTIIGGLAVGYFLDQFLGTSPWLLITLTAIAFAGAFMRLVRWFRYFASEGDEKRGKKDHPAD
jgi:F0F1-type ATP synthase assembly protein I